MSRNFKRALDGLKDTYPHPDPERREAFLRSLPQKQEEREHAVLPLFHTGRKPLYFALPAVVTAALMITVGISTYRHHQPHSIPSIPVESTTTVSTTTYTQTVSEVESQNETTEVAGIAPPFPTESWISTQITTEEASGGTAATGNHTLPQLDPVFPVQTAPHSASTAPMPATLFPVQTTSAHAATKATEEQADSPATVPSDSQPDGTYNHETTTTKRMTQTTAAPDPIELTTATRRTTAATTTTRPKMTTTTKAMTSAKTTTAHTTTTTAATYTNIWWTTTDPMTTQAEEATINMTTEAATEDMEFPEPTVQPTEQPTVSAYTTVIAYDPLTPEQVANAKRILDWSTEGTKPSTESDGTIWWHTPADAATDVVQGTLDAITYTHVGGEIYTKYDFRVGSTLKGSHSGGTISVYEPGGYISLGLLRSYSEAANARTSDWTWNDIDGTYVYEKGSGLSPAEYGTTYVLLLREANDPAYPSGAYVYAAAPENSRLTLTNSMNCVNAGGASVGYYDLLYYLR
ncbi:MAG: hypothetical protein II916_07570 [Oscillospiraceae bacterium]|nr:hypothetical protein [Oscillospiraceae bacterium]